MELTSYEQEMLDGVHGRAKQKAMEILVTQEKYIILMVRLLSLQNVPQSQLLVINRQKGRPFIDCVLFMVWV